MKKIKYFALMSAIALTSTIGFTACSSSEDAVAEDNPNYNPETKEVITQFVFNVSAANAGKTRMTSANTQASTSELFRGIENAQLFAYKLGTGGSRVTSATDANKTYNLGNILSPGQLDPDGTTTKSQRIIELALPTETTTLMFWGKAPQSGVDPDNAQGKISFNASSSDISNHAFSLVPRVASSSAAETKLQHYEEIIIKLLNGVVTAKYTVAAAGLVWSATENGDGSKNTTPIDLSWSDLIDVNATTKALTSGASTTEITTTDSEPATTCTRKSIAECPLGEILVKAFISLNTVYDDEARAGSGQAIKHTMADLRTVIRKVSQATPTSYDEFIAKQLGIVIEGEISKIVNVDGNMQSYATLKTNAGLDYSDVDGNFDFVSNSSPGFPGNVGLPDGAVQLQVTISETKPVATWSYKTNNSPTMFNYSINQYTYPAEICYFGNSPVRITDNTHVAADYPDGSTEWVNDNNTKWSGWTKNGKVLSSTRSVAMQENINYGTALLKTTVSIDGSDTEPLLDNNATIQNQRTGSTEANREIIPTGSLFTLTGILVGGQSRTVGWNYLPTTSFDYAIYDKNIVSSAVPVGSPSTPNYTLVWDNYNSGVAANLQTPVYVALEFMNNAGNFWGEKNLIRNNEKFYLIGKLQPAGDGNNVATSGTGSSITWPAYPMPPYDTSGSTVTTLRAPRVFIQDYVTTANFVIGETSLQHAYNSVPDLRSSQISLGLSVDLQWSAGLTFNSTLGDY